MGNIKGYFRGLHSDKLYSVRIIADETSEEFDEVMLSDSPFSVRYDDSNSLFDPMRISTATISIVNDNYMLDIFSSKANGTRVVLVDEGNGTIKWSGYLKPNLYNQGYVDEYETIQLEASDCLAALQYFDYEVASTTKSVVSFKTIIDNMFNRVGNIGRYAIMAGKKLNGSALTFDAVTISEQNFFSSDSDEPWKCNEVFEEICRYLGYSALQIGDCVYFIDYGSLSKKSNTSARQFIKDSSGNYVAGSNVSLGGAITIDSNDPFMGDSHTFSLDNIYNQVVVKCSTYKIEDLLPDIYSGDDEVITPMFGDWTNCQYIACSSSKGNYINKNGGVSTEQEADDKYVYVNRFLKHKYFEPVYYDFNMNPVTNTDRFSVITTISNFTPQTSSFSYWDIGGEGSELEMSGVTGCNFTVSLNNTDSVSHTVRINVNIEGHRDWYLRMVDMWAPEGWETWYSACGEHDGYDYGNTTETLTDSKEVTVPAGATRSVSFSMVFANRIACGNDSEGKTYTTLYPSVKYTGNVSIDNATPVPLTSSPFGSGSDGADSSSSPTFSYIGATLVDYASYERIPTTVYNFEPTSSLDFTRYLCINQHNQPYGNFFGPGLDLLPTPWGIETYQTSESLFPTVYRLKSGFKRPLISGANTFIAINADVLYERYVGKPYINSEWTDEATGFKNSLFSKHTKTVGAASGALILSLGFGNKFWNGSSWQNGKCIFRVPLSTQVDDEWKCDLSKMWNTNFHILNNFSWEEWADAEGYKIPLDSSVDASQEVTFEIHMPSKLQYYQSNDSTEESVGKTALNGYCWITNFNIKVANKGQNSDTNLDVVYKNVLESESINELNETTLKINTNPNKGPLSYSYAGLSSGGYLQTIAEDGLNGVSQKPEENLIERMVRQYSSTTKKESLVVNMDFTPLRKVIDGYWSEQFAIVGQEIDYRNDTQTITLLQLK